MAFCQKRCKSCGDIFYSKVISEDHLDAMSDSPCVTFSYQDNGVTVATIMSHCEPCLTMYSEEDEHRRSVEEQSLAATIEQETAQISKPVFLQSFETIVDYDAMNLHELKARAKLLDLVILNAAAVYHGYATPEKVLQELIVNCSVAPFNNHFKE